MKKAMNVRINIKPVFSNLVHTAVWEGPCRVGPAEELDPKYEVRAGLEKMKIWAEEMRANVSPAIGNVLEPEYIQFDESFVVKDNELEKLEKDLAEVDLFVITYRIPGIERLGKPIAMVDRGPTSVDLIGFYQSEGIEAYMAHEWDEFNELINALYVKKAMRNTKILIMTSSNEFSAGVNTSIPYKYGLFTKYGIRHTAIPMVKVFDEMAGISDSECMKVARDIHDNATEAFISTEYISQDVKYFEAIKSLMERFDCNAFTTACKELCASRLPMKNKCTPCLCHTLLKDMGFPSACEEDLNALMAVMVFMYATKRSVFMGNPFLVLKGTSPLKDEGVSRVVFGPSDGFDREVLEIQHSVPSRLMNGLDSDPMPYELGSFTHAGWGTKFQINMAEGETRTVTFGRFDRKGEKMILAQGTIVGCAYSDDACSPAVYYDVKGGARALRFALAEGGYGHHLAVVYGDQIELMQKVGKVVGFKTEVFGM